jgi:hypothetical protein
MVNLRSNNLKKLTTEASRQQLLQNSHSSGNSIGNYSAGSYNNPDQSGYNMAFIQTVIRRTMIAILLFALLIRLQMMYGSSYVFQWRQQPLQPRGDHITAAPTAKRRHSVTRQLKSEQSRLGNMHDTVLDPSSAHAVPGKE